MEIKDEVKARATVIRKVDNIQTYELNQFDNNEQTQEIINTVKPQEEPQQEVIQPTQQLNINIDSILDELGSLNQKISSLQANIDSLKDFSFSTKELDAQIVKALKELKQQAQFYKQASLAYEEKLLKTSFSIAKKIIGIELSQNSTKIAKETVNNLMEKIKGASKISIHLNPKDYIVLKDELEVEGLVKIEQDSNVTAGGVVISSDLGNFDGNIESKIESISQTLELIS